MYTYIVNDYSVWLQVSYVHMPSIFLYIIYRVSTIVYYAYIFNYAV